MKEAALIYQAEKAKNGKNQEAAMIANEINKKQKTKTKNKHIW